MENLEPNPISVRIAELIACKTGGSRTLFAHKVGWSKQRLTNILAGKGIGLATVEALLRTFPDLNARWMIMGEGYMLHVTEPKLGTKYTLIKAFERYLPYMTQTEVLQLTNGHNAWTDEDVKRWQSLEQRVKADVQARFQTAYKRQGNSQKPT